MESTSEMETAPPQTSAEHGQHEQSPHQVPSNEGLTTAGTSVPVTTEGAGTLGTETDESGMDRGRQPRRRSRGLTRSATRGARARGQARGHATREGPRQRGGRGRGRGRAVAQRLSVDEIERQQAERRAERQQHIRDMINRLELEGLRDILLTVAERQPGLFFDIWERQDHPVDPQQQQQSRNGQPHWCTCSRCASMRTNEENVCCSGIPEDCLSIQPEMDRLVLDPMVLGIAQAMRNDILALNPNQADPNRSLRHAAYRQYILWVYGRLGRGNRRVIPSCVVLRIRENFPDRLGVYTGYMPNRLA